ncbi:uncharacterized protein Smp_200980 [Schistosoma mansoni]|uniref:Smp_200980 n=1 Tax=Schistosoma mansoni TaxID=6183 RepID=G4V5K9_SCHMA|nr:uncharacterized protein Smp_200980 [Schistosoma mansoni]|eukprot:XP_018648527.1 uncharacterized protein Smp_200980 [Schistosoma mansoni]
MSFVDQRQQKIHTNLPVVIWLHFQSFVLCECVSSKIYLPCQNYYIFTEKHNI